MFPRLGPSMGYLCGYRLFQREMSSCPVVVGEIGAQEPPSLTVRKVGNSVVKSRLAHGPNSIPEASLIVGGFGGCCCLDGDYSGIEMSVHGLDG